MAARRAVGGGVDERPRARARRRDDGLDLVVTLGPAPRGADGRPRVRRRSTVPRRTDARLREVDFGDLNGAPVDVVHAQRRQPGRQPFPGGQSYREVTAGDARAARRAARDPPDSGCCWSATQRPGSPSTTCSRRARSRRAVVAPFAWREGWEYVARPSSCHGSTSSTVRPRSPVRDELTDVYRARSPHPATTRTRSRCPLPGRPAADARRARRLPARARARRRATCSASPTATPVSTASGGPTRWPPRRRTALVDAWLGGHFEVVELAVAAGWHRAAASGPRWSSRCCSACRTSARCSRRTTTTGRRRGCTGRLGLDPAAEGVFDGSDLWGLVLPRWPYMKNAELYLRIASAVQLDFDDRRMSRLS